MNIQVNNLGRKCYNEKAIAKQIKKDRKRQKKLRKVAEKQARAEAYAASQHQVQDMTDTEAILAFAEVRGCRELGVAFVRAGLGSLQDFKNALTAQSIRIKELFPGGIGG
jgi:hypothetical protein